MRLQPCRHRAWKRSTPSLPPAAASASGCLRNTGNWGCPANTKHLTWASTAFSCSSTLRCDAFAGNTAKGSRNRSRSAFSALFSAAAFLAIPQVDQTKPRLSRPLLYAIALALLARGRKVIPVEVKSASTFHPNRVQLTH